jgi:hypothetical protein
VSKVVSSVRGQTQNTSGPNPFRQQSDDQLKKSRSSFEDLIVEHEDKLAKFKANPDAFDNKGVLRNAGSPEIRDKIIAGRVRTLQQDIGKQRSELQKLVEAIKERK